MAIPALRPTLAATAGKEQAGPVASAVIQIKNYDIKIDKKGRIRRIRMKIEFKGMTFDRWHSSGCPWLPSVGCQLKEPDSEVSSPGEVEDPTLQGRSSTLK